MLANLFTFKLSGSKHSFFKNHILLILFFACAYYISSLLVDEAMYKKQHNDMILNNNDMILNKQNSNSDFASFFDCLYFSLVTQTTVGYGDIVPKHMLTKIINVVQLMTIYGVLLIEL